MYDSAAKAYTQPFFLHNDGLAIRAFQDNVNSDQETNITKHPDQFTLFKIGEYEDQTGEIVKLDNLKSLGNGLEYKNIDETHDSMSLILQKLDKLLEDK